MRAGCSPHSQERQRPSFIIQLFAADLLETAAAVEGAGGLVLLIDLDRELPEPLGCMVQEKPPNASAMRLGRHEQAADVIIDQSDESENHVPLHSYPIVRMRDVDIPELRQLLLERLFAKEGMADPRRIEPDVEECRSVAGHRASDVHRL